jgi:hypothetical protein
MCCILSPSALEVAGKIGFWKNIELRIPNKWDPNYSTVEHTAQSTSTLYVKENALLVNTVRTYCNEMIYIHFK